MSHTTENLHDVAGVTVGMPTLSADKNVRYQTVRVHFTDGGTHDITAFLSPGATAFPLRMNLDKPVQEAQGKVAPREPLRMKDPFDTSDPILGFPEL